MEIQEIKERLTIGQVLGFYGLVVNKNKHIHCPFHADKTPSMKVYQETNTVHCFSGNCRLQGKSLDVIGFVQEKEETSKHAAIMRCKELLGSRLNVVEGYVPETKTKRQVVDSLWRSLEESFKNVRCKARAYAQSRGLGLAGLGYNVGSWHRRKDRTEEELQAAKELGFLLATEFNAGLKVWGKNCLIFPLRDVRGRVVSFYGRAVSVAGHYYMKNRSGLFPRYPATTSKRVILTESIIDAASLLEIASIKEQYSVLALYGTNGYTQEHKTALANIEQLEEVVIMLDGDEAGHKASEKLSEQLQQQLPSTIIKIVSLPEGTDVNELWVNHLSGELFTELLESATVASAPEPEAIKPSLDLQIVNSNYYIYNSEALKIEVLGGISIDQIDRLQCTLRVTRKPQRNSLDKVRQNLNLYHAGQVKGLVTRLHEQLELPLQGLRLLVADLTEQLEAYRASQQALGEAQSLRVRQVPALRKKAALAYLQASNLMDQTWTDLGRVGIVGEEKTR